MTWVVVDDPIPGGAHHPRQRPRPRLADRDAGEKRAGQRVARVRGAHASRPFAPTTSTCRRAASSLEYTRAPQQPGHVRAAADARRGDVRAGDASARSRTPACEVAAVSAWPRRAGICSLSASSPRSRRAARPRIVRRGAARRVAVRRCAARPPRRAARRRCASTRAVRRLAWIAARRRVAGAARTRIVAQRGPALLRARRRRLAGGARRRLGQPVEHAHARRVDAHDAARRPARRRPRARRPRGRSTGAEARPGGAARELERDVDEGRRSSRPTSTPCRSAASSSASTRRAQRCSARRRAGSTRARRRSPRRWCARPNARRRRSSRSAPAACCTSQRAALRRRAPRSPRRRWRGAAAARARRAAGAAPRARCVVERARRARVQHDARRAAAALRRHAPCAASSAELRGRNVEDGAVVVLDNASGDVLRLGRLERRPVRRAPQVDGVLRAPPARLDAQALPLRARVRAAAAHRRRRCSTTRRSQIATARGLYLPQNYDRELPGLRERAHRARAPPQRAGGARRAMLGADALARRACSALGFDR